MVEVNQLGKTIKAIRSYLCDEYYDRYDISNEQHPSPFNQYLEEYGIIPQYTIIGCPGMNGVV